MSTYTLPTPDLSQQDPYALYGYYGAGSGGFSPYYGGTDTSSQNWGTAIGANGQDVNPNASMEDVFSANRNQISNTGNLIGQEAGNQLNYYGPLQQQYTSAENAALNQLQQTPGYTSQEAGQINTDYSQFNTSPDQWGAINSTVNNGVNNEGTTLNQYQSGLGGTLNNYGSQLGGATSAYQGGLTGGVNTLASDIGGAEGANSTAVNGATSGLASGLNSAQSKFAPLDTAVNNPALGFDPNSTEKQMTDQDVNDITTAAGTTVGNQFQSQQDSIARAAAAQGNTSPEALAAMERDLTTQGAATAGDAMTSARINALQAQYQRAAGIEQQREGAVQTQTGLQATAATTEEAAAQAAAGQAGQANIGAQQFLSNEGFTGAQTVGEAGLEAAQMGGQAGINTANTMGQANIGALNSYYPAAVNEQNTMTGQQYSAGVNQANTQYAQGTGSAQLTSAGAQATGNARMQGQSAYRSGVAGQQGMAQQGGQAAQQAQLGAYGTQTSGLTGNASAQGSFETNKASLGDTAAKQVTNLWAKGGVATEPTIAKIAEHGPEMVVELPQSGGKMAPYKSSRYRSKQMDGMSFGKAA